MAPRVFVAYLLILGGLVAAGFLLDLSWWMVALVGAVVVTPVAVSDISRTRRRAHPPGDD